MTVLDQQTSDALVAFLSGMARSNANAGVGGVGLRHDIGSPSTSPHPAHIFSPYGEDSVRVYWLEGNKPLADWLPLEPATKVEDTVEYLGYLVPNQDPAAPGVQDGNTDCPNCGQPNCSGTTGNICDSFGKTADFGPVIRYNMHMGEIRTSSHTYDWTKANAGQNRGIPKRIELTSAIDGRQIVLTGQKQIFAYLANYEWYKEFSWSMWGGHGYNGSFPGLLEVVRPGWAKENEFIIDGKGIPDNVYMDPSVINMGGMAYAEHPWIIAERVAQVVRELTSRGTPPRRVTMGGVNNVLIDFAFVSAPEWMTHFAKIAARTGMLNEWGNMPDGFSFSVSADDSERRYLAMTMGGLGYGFIPTPSGNVPFIPEDYCDPRKIPAVGCQRSADECDLADTYSVTARLLVRRAGTKNALALQYLDYRVTADMPMDVSDVRMGDAGRWLTSYPKSVTGFCERAVQVGNAGMVNRAPTLQTVFTNLSFRQYLTPDRFTVGSKWFKGGPPSSIKTAQTATRDLTLTDLDGSGALTLDGTATSISGSDNIYTITSTDLDALGVVPVGTLFTSGAYTGHVAHYNDDTNTIVVYGDLSGVPNGSAFTLGVATDCEDCADTDTLTVASEDDCVVVRATYTGTLVSATAGQTLVVDSTILEALADHALVGGFVYVAGAEVGRIASFLTPSDASIILAAPTNVPLAAGDTVTIYFDTGCETDDAAVESVEAFITVPQLPITGTDAVKIGFVSKTGVTKSMSLVSGWPVPDDTYVASTSVVAMYAVVTAQNVSSGGVEKTVDFKYESDDVAGVFATVRIPYSKA